ncbi:MAG TPA: penicillin-binding protein 2 [Candidatus Limnocylindria bacterium]|nr:penicillin-binding protein 2 [Candidatus Limnocylindria bacterium]
MLARTDSRIRAVVMLVVMVLVAGLIGYRLVWWQVIDRERLANIGLAQLAHVQQIPAARGLILDREGLILATSLTAESVFATPPTIVDPARSARLLGAVLGADPAELETTLAGEAAWTWLSRRVSPETATRVRALGLPGVGLVTEPRRVYTMNGAVPGTTLGAQVLGFVNVDGVGQYGVEGAEDAILAGTPGSVVAQEDVAGRLIAGSVHELESPVNGADVTLTIDAGLQHLLEEQVADNFTRNRAKGVTALVMDVHSGAILALASVPTFDANAYPTTDPTLFSNPAVSRQYEPGSVLKAMTVAAALDAGAISPTDLFLDDNKLKVYDVTISNADRQWFPNGHGLITPAEVLALSNNVGAATIGLTLGGQRLYDALLRYGFGQPTGVDIAGEAAGVVHHPDDPGAAKEVTTAQNSFGQGISVTVLQMAAAYAAIANGGQLVTPHVVAGWTDGEGTFTPRPLPEPEQVMQPETAGTVLEMLTGAIDNGIASAAAVPGYSIAGKTGTAQVAGPVKVRVRTGTDASGQPVYEEITRQAYIEGWIDSSFIGIAPADDPKFVMMILIHRPAVSRSGIGERSDVAFSQLAPLVFDYFGIPPDRSVPGVAHP